MLAALVVTSPKTLDVADVKRNRSQEGLGFESYRPNTLWYSAYHPLWGVQTSHRSMDVGGNPA
jgi:hypothetical protein